MRCPPRFTTRPPKAAGACAHRPDASCASGGCLRRVGTPRRSSRSSAFPSVDSYGSVSLRPFWPLYHSRFCLCCALACTSCVYCQDARGQSPAVIAPVPTTLHILGNGRAVCPPLYFPLPHSRAEGKRRRRKAVGREAASTTSGKRDCVLVGEPCLRMLRHTQSSRSHEESKRHKGRHPYGRSLPIAIAHTSMPRSLPRAWFAVGPLAQYVIRDNCSQIRVYLRRKGRWLNPPALRLECR